MIEANKSRWFSAWFARHCERRLRSSFEELRVHGLEHLEQAGALGPVLIVSNHTAWWDPLVAIYLTQRLLRLDSYAMMDAKNLRKLPFFAKVGAFGVDLDQPSDRGRSVRYAARLLRSGSRVLWIFAQGDERPITEPLQFQPGSTAIARLASNASVVPVALRYEMGNVERPRALISIGAPVPAGQSHQQAVADELERIERWVRGAGSEFRCILQAPRPFWGALAARWLAVLTRSALQPARRPEHQPPSPPA